MSNSNWELIQKKKSDRKKKVRNIVDENDIFDHKDVIQILKGKYSIDASQPTISRDFDELGIKPDSVTGKYILGERVARNREGKKLERIFQQASAEIVQSDWKCMMIRMKKSYLEVAAEQIESFFEVDKVNVGIFFGYGGAMMLYYDEKDAGKVEKYLKQIVVHYQE